MLQLIILFCREQRNTYIRTKYESRRYAIRTCADEQELREELYQAVETCDIHALLQVWAEGIDLMTSIPGEVSTVNSTAKDYTCLFNIEQLYKLDFLFIYPSKCIIPASIPLELCFELAIDIMVCSYI